MNLKHTCIRRSFSLVEILVAMGVLAVGMIGICALLPLGIRNTTAALHGSVGASVAQTAFTSLEHYSLDLSRENGGFDTNVLSGNSVRFPGEAFPYTAPPDGLLKDNGTFSTVRYMGESGYSWSGVLTPSQTDRWKAEVAVWFQPRMRAEARMYVDYGGESEFTAQCNPASKNRSAGLFIESAADSRDRDVVRMLINRDLELRAGDHLMVDTDTSGHWRRISAVLAAGHPASGWTQARFELGASFPNLTTNKQQKVWIPARHSLIGIYDSTIIFAQQ
jgi:hypothetical protein